MRKKDPTVYLEDILYAIERIESYAMGGKQAFLKEAMKQDAIIRQFAVIGEATKKLSPSTKEKHPHIRWQRIAGMRDILVHDYAEIDLDIVWNAVKEELLPLKKAVRELLESNGQ